MAKKQNFLYIRTNNNNDDTAKILKNWLEKVQSSYLGVYFDDKDVKKPVQNYKQYEWNALE